MVRFDFPPPWRIAGEVVQGIWLIDSAHVAEYIPKQFEIVNVLGSKTICCLQFNNYNHPHSLLQYQELIVNPALVAYNGRKGFWSSHIYVNTELSLSWGHLLGLPKEIATFEWNRNRFAVKQDHKLLLEAEFAQPVFRWNMPFNRGTGFGLLDGKPVYFNILKGHARGVGIGRIRPRIPTDSTLSFLSMLQPTWIALNHRMLDCLWNKPTLA
ncbi:MAG: acetoacetate decarboxylase family protein [Leptolyngbyaceae cyanobacterium bins.59]|nr:acetoacetate decarboxylase family protein [Leptolyngbyaceae cyanobacterium bins.59]